MCSAAKVFNGQCSRGYWEGGGKTDDFVLSHTHQKMGQTVIYSVTQEM